MANVPSFLPSFPHGQSLQICGASDVSSLKQNPWSSLEQLLPLDADVCCPFYHCGNWGNLDMHLAFCCDPPNSAWPLGKEVLGLLLVWASGTLQPWIGVTWAWAVLENKCQKSDVYQVCNCPASEHPWPG